MTTAIVYARFSPRRNAEECQSNETQLQICRQYCQDQGYAIADEYEDRKASGASTKRKGLHEALGALKRGWVLVTHSGSRLSRNFMDREAMFDRIERRGAYVDLVSQGGRLKNDPESKMMRRLLGIVDQFEREQTAKRTSASAKQRQKNGQAMSAIAPYGKRAGRPVEVVKDGKAAMQRTWEDDPAEQAVIAQIRVLRDAGKGLREIARALNDEGVASRGAKWSHVAVKRILTREKI